MIKILTVLLLLASCLAKQRQIQDLLQHTQTINYTFYHTHQYHNHNNYGVLISIKQTDRNADHVSLKVNQSYQKVTALLQPLGFSTNLTSKSEELQEQTEIQWTLQVTADNNVTELGVLLDQLALLSKNSSNLFIWSVFKHGHQMIDREIELFKAKETADKRGKKICEQHMGWQFKEMAVFDQVILQTQQQQEVMVGEYVQLLETIQSHYKPESNEVIYKCQIICERKNRIDLLAGQKMKKKAEKKGKKSKQSKQRQARVGKQKKSKSGKGIQNKKQR